MKGCLVKTIVVFLIGLITLLSTDAAEAAWYNSSWQYRKKLTIDYTKVGAALTNFPVLVSLATDADLAADAQDDGDDILFTSADGTTKLDHEIESFNGSTGQLVAWVRLPSLSNSADTEIYLYYGNGSCSSQQNKTGVWDSNFKGVWHLQQSGNGTSGEFTDSTSNVNNAQGGSGIIGGSATPSRATGKIGYGQDFERDNTQFISIPNAASLQLTTNFTLEAWGYAETFIAGWQFPNLVARQYGTGAADSYSLSFGNGTASAAPFYSWYNGGSLNTGATTYGIGTWLHVVAVIGNSASYLYINGSQVASGGGITTSTDTNPTLIGGQENNSTTTPTWDSLWDGIIDEVRISNTTRTAGWISTAYNNTSDPGPGSGKFFKSLGIEETDSGSSYSYRKPVTIDYTKVGASCSSNLTSFPVLISIASDADLRTTGNGGNVQNASGYDITFRASDGTTVFDHEVEAYDPTNGQLVAWVRIPTLDYNDNTTIYIYYGNAAISSSQENKTGVWDSNYKGVWHLKESGSGAAGEYKDSTLNANNGQGAGPAPALADGMVDGAQNFDGSNDYISVPSSTSLQLTSSLTIQGWVRLDGFGSGADVDIVGRKGEDNPNNYQLCIANSTLSLKLDENDDGGLFGATLLSTGTWYHVTGTWDGTTRRVYVNGVEDGSGSRGGTINTDARPFYIGGRSGTDLSDGIVDEVRVSNIARPACWIQTEYNNQGSPGTFYSIGAEQDLLGAADLTQIHARWRNDDGSEGGINTGTGADGAISLSAALNLNTQARAGGRTYPDGVAYRVKAVSGTSITLGNAAGSTLGNTNGIAAGDEILIINLQGSSGDNGSVGNYEFLTVQSVSGGVVTVASAPSKDYDGSGNSFTTQKVFVQRVPQYTNVTTNAHSITAGDWDGGADHDDSSCTDNQYTGILAFRATGTVTVSASGSITASGKGYRGGAGATGNNGGTNGESFDGTVGSGGNSTSTGTSGGGSGDANSSKGTQTSRGGGGGGGGDGDAGEIDDGAGGGGGGGYGGGGGGGGGGADCSNGGTSGGSGGDTGVSAGGGGGDGDCANTAQGGNAGSAGNGPFGGAAGSGATTGQGGGGGGGANEGAGGAGGGGTYGAAPLTSLFFGSGGGGGGGSATSGGGSAQSGGDGGGIIYIIANTVTVSGAITSNGNAGSAANVNHGGGGGGAGGSILIQANSATLGTTLVTATGGGTAPGTTTAGGGGGGGVGRIRVEASSLTGTTNPSASTSTEWWNSSWNKRKDITIDNTGNASTLTNYQVKVAVTYDSDMQTDFDDIRFTNASGTLLDHWLESKTDGSTATFWVEVDTIPASSTATIYMYYGNASATSTSSLTNTFINNSIYLEARRCTDSTNCITDSHAEFDSIVAGNYTLDGSGYRTAVNDAENPYSGTDDYYFMRYRFLYRADTTGTHYFGVNSDDASELHRPDAGDTDSTHTVLAYWYGGHASGTCGTSGTRGSVSLTSGQVIWLEYRMTEWTGGQLAQTCIQEPGSGYQTVTTANFAGQLFSRTITTGTEPTVSTGNEGDKPVAGATWAADEDDQLTGAKFGTLYRLRFSVYNSGSIGSGPVAYKLQVARTNDCGSGTYTDVLAKGADNSAHWQLYPSSYLTDGAATTNVAGGLNDPNSGFVAGQVKTLDGTTGTITLDAGQFTELEFAVKATANAASGVDYCFRLVLAATSNPLDTYTSYGRVEMAACNFGYRKPITVQSGQVSSGPQTNFPMLVNINSDNDLRTTANGGDVTSSSGYDIVFRGLDATTCGGTAPCTLAHEIEKYDPSNGQLVAWVKVPSINNGTVIYLYYGNSCVSGSTEDGTDVWDANFKGVWHLHTVFTDSTSNANNGTNGSTADATGKMANGRQYAGENNFISVADNNSLTPSGDMTFSAWVYLSSLPHDTMIVQKNHLASPWQSFQIGIYEPTHATYPSKPRFGWHNGTTWYEVRSSSTISTGAWHHLVGVHSGTALKIYMDGNDVSSGTVNTTGTLINSTGTLTMGNDFDGSGTRFPHGVIDEYRISSTARSAGWIATEYNNQNAPSSFYSLGGEQALAVTAVTLLDFRAQGEGPAVKVSWQTALESRNMGFHLYRAERREGPFARLTERMISGGFDSAGGSYSFTDTGAVRGRLYYYLLEDVDVRGQATRHGPICVDWDADGLPDDWEVAHGLNPNLNDADLDPDRDGVANRLEYERGTDPFNWDTDGDGIPDGLEKKSSGGSAPAVSRDLSVQVLSADASGVTLELLTEGFDVSPVALAGQEFERLRIPGYVHGVTAEEGLPELPQKGVMIDLPAGARARLTVLETTTRRLAGYRVYPAPAHQLNENEELVEVFRWEEAFYRQDAFYPQATAALSGSYLFRGEGRQRVLFYPLQFNPAAGELLHHERIRVRVDFETLHRAAASFAAAAAGEGAGGWPIAGAAAVKLSTGEEGIYRVSREWLAAQGLSAAEIDAIDLRRVQLYQLGVEQALEVYDASGDGRLDAGDWLGFYAEPVAAEFAKYARENVYWLIDAGSTSPKRMERVEGAPAGGALALSHTYRLHDERNLGYVPTAPGPDGLERWLYANVIGAGHDGGGPRNLSLSLPGAQGGGELHLKLYAPYDLAHAASVAVNGVLLGTVTWQGIGFAEQSFGGAGFVAGVNTVTITSLNEQDKLAVDWLAADYPRGFTAEGDRLKFTHAGGFRYQVGGFGSAEAALYDISTPEAAKRVEHPVVSGSGPFALEAEPAAAGLEERTYFAAAGAALRAPAAAVAGREPVLGAWGGGADWILITHRALGWEAGGAPRPWVSSLVALREEQGLRTAVVDVADIYDEFGYGLPAPEAIKAFLRHAFERWPRPAPRYVLLAGAASYDYKNNWNLSPASVNYVPAYLIFTTHGGETACDECYGQVSGADGLSDLLIGRLPAASPEQAAAMAAKIVAYERALNTKSWQRRVVLAADNARELWEAVFETMNEEQAGQLPAGMELAQRYYLGEYENESLAVSDLTADLIAGINAGALWVNYSGHGSVNIWATEKILDHSGTGRLDLNLLANGGMPSLVVNMACLTGYFIYPQTGRFAAAGYRSLAEGLMLPEGRGAVGALMPSGMTATDGQQVLSRALAEAVFARDLRRLGDAVGAAREELIASGGAAALETSNTFVLFGDPATELKVPLPRRVAGVSAAQAQGAVELNWAAALDCNGGPVAGYNLYRRQAGSSERVRLNGVLITDLSAVEDWLAAGLTPGQSYFYAVTAVDADGDESVPAAEVGIALTALDGDGDGYPDGDDLCPQDPLKAAPGVCGCGVTDADADQDGIADCVDPDGGKPKPTPDPAGTRGGSGGGGGGCFIASTGWGAAADLLRPAGVMALLICLVWISRKRRE